MTEDSNSRSATQHRSNITVCEPASVDGSASALSSIAPKTVTPGLRGDATNGNYGPTTLVGNLGPDRQLSGGILAAQRLPDRLVLTRHPATRWLKGMTFDARQNSSQAVSSALRFSRTRSR